MKVKGCTVAVEARCIIIIIINCRCVWLNHAWAWLGLAWLDRAEKCLSFVLRRKMIAQCTYLYLCLDWLERVHHNHIQLAQLCDNLSRAYSTVLSTYVGNTSETQCKSLSERSTFSTALVLLAACTHCLWTREVSCQEVNKTLEYTVWSIIIRRSTLAL